MGVRQISRSWHVSPLALLAGLAVSAGCVGKLAGSDGATPGTSSGASSGTSSGDVPTEALPAATTRVARLSHVQYDNSVRWLLGLDVSPSKELSPDPAFGGYDNNAEKLAIAGQQAGDYRREAESLAEQAVSDAKAFAALAPCATPETTACGADFVKSFGLRAFRRPLVDDEQADYLALYEKGKDLFTEGSVHARGVRLVLEAMFQAPSFLYRVELNDTPVSPGVTRPSSYEMAARLSYLLWNAAPDAALLEGAAKGEPSTPEAIAERARAMLSDARARDMVRDFHAQWLGISAYSNITRDAALFPSFSSDMGPLLQDEALAFVNDVVFEQRGGLTALLTSPVGFVNDRLAPLYGLGGSFGAGLQRVDLDPKVRPGLFTRVGFLAANAHATSTAPILRGVFLLKRVLCTELGSPPAGASTSAPPPFSDTIRTTRDQVTEHTKNAPCSSCHHTLINPVGFAFEHFDSVGQWRDLDRGYPIDATGDIRLPSGELAFDGAADFAAKASRTPEARQCYARSWLRYGYGRIETSGDAPTIAALATHLGESGYGVEDMIVDLTRTPTFYLRADSTDGGGQ